MGQPAGNQNEGNPVSFAYRLQPIIPVYDIMGNFAGTKGGDLDNARNPVALLYRNKDNVGKDLRIFGNAFLEADILPNLTARTSFGVDYTTFNIRTFNIRDIESSESASNSNLSTNNNYEATWTWYNTLTYKFRLGAYHRFNVILGTESISSYFEQFAAGRANFSWTTWTTASWTPVTPVPPPTAAMRPTGALLQNSGRSTMHSAKSTW